jgi:hypothetical protein
VDSRSSTSGKSDPGERFSRFMTAQKFDYEMKLLCADDGAVSEAGFFVEASYLIFKVRFDAPLLIDIVCDGHGSS